MVGIMVTCDVNKEKRVIKECFNLLNAYVEKFYPGMDFKAIKDDYDKVQAEKKAAREAFWKAKKAAEAAEKGEQPELKEQEKPSEEVVEAKAEPEIEKI